ncbi:unnamed protein product [Scytosiphon promiscuus]
MISSRGKRGPSSTKGRDHINALGLPNDGYDYEQHLKSMGGGTFVSKGGKVQHFAESNTQGARGGAAKATIPEEALPSGETLDRQLEAVTISEKVMDSDMRRALAPGLADVIEEYDSDEDGEGNLLDDDFVMQAAGAGDVRALLVDSAPVSEKREGGREETRETQRNGENEVLIPSFNSNRSNEGFDFEAHMARLMEARSDDSGEIDEALLEGGSSAFLAAFPLLFGAYFFGLCPRITRVYVVCLQTLAEYDSDEWGELEEDDNRVQGKWDVEKHNYANTCLDEFLASKEDARWTEGVERLRPELRGIATATLAIDRTATAAAEAAAGDSSAAPVAAAGGGALHDMEHHNEYLRDKPADQWDCETIVSTYTNLDNHPSVLGTGRKPKPSRPRRAPPSAGNAAAGDGDGGNASPVQQVTLSEKTGLPVGVLPERTFNDAGMVSLIAGKNKGEKRDTEESAEEKRRRKAEIKQSRRDKRAQKKSVKVAFTGEAKVISHALANPEAPQNRSVFSYS